MTSEVIYLVVTKVGPCSGALQCSVGWGGAAVAVLGEADVRSNTDGYVECRKS